MDYKYLLAMVRISTATQAQLIQIAPDLVTNPCQVVQSMQNTER
jgi:hypothetical protein